jgi:hypothetical protein
MTTFDENTHKPTSHEREENRAYRRTQEASSILLLLILFALVFAISTTCGAEETKASKTKPYPDKWYQAYPGKERISNICFSDKDIWGDEPVVFLDENRVNNGAPKYLTHRTTMVGFFSGKRKKIYQKCKLAPAGHYDCDKYKYVGTKRAPKECEYIAPQTAELKIVETVDGGKLNDEQIATWASGEIFGELFDADIRKKAAEYRAKNQHLTIEERNKIREMGKAYISRLINRDVDSIKLMEHYCETAKTYLVKRDKAGNIVWAKAFMRYYPDRSVAPTPGYALQCAGADESEKVRMDSKADPKLLLADGTILVGAPGAVVRIRQEDGGTKLVPDKYFRVFEAVAVMKEKLEFTKKQAALENKCEIDGKDLSSKECGLYNSYYYEINERLQLDLAKKLFNLK